MKYPFNITEMKKHGMPHDRGSADFWYHRPRQPHYWPDGTYNGVMVEKSDMTMEEITAYHCGYDEAELNGDQKEW